LPIAIIGAPRDIVVVCKMHHNMLWLMAVFSRSLFSIKERERTAFNRQVDTFAICPTLDFVEQLVHELQSVIGVVFEPKLRQ